MRCRFCLTKMWFLFSILFYITFADYVVQFDVIFPHENNAAESFQMEIYTDWAPRGAARFRELVEAQYFDGARFFRVIKNFMAQFGIAADPEVTKKHRTKSIKDEPVIHSNEPGTITFAMGGKNTRSTQLFINFVHNKYLDKEGFTPIGKCIKNFDTILKIYSGYGEGAPSGKGPDQGRANQLGEEYLADKFEKLTIIQSVRIIPKMKIESEPIVSEADMEEMKERRQKILQKAKESKTADIKPMSGKAKTIIANSLDAQQQRKDDLLNLFYISSFIIVTGGCAAYYSSRTSKDDKKK